MYNNFMKNVNTPTAIIIGALIIAASILIVSMQDPLAKCMDKVIAEGRNAAVAANFCSGKSNK